MDQVVATFPGAMIIVGADFKIVEISNNAISLLNLKTPKGVIYSREALIGLSSKNIFTKLKNPNLIQTFNRLEKKVKQDKKTHTESRVILTKNVFVRFSFAPILKYNEVGGYCLYFIDEFETILKEIGLENQKALMISSSRLSALGEMAAGIGHEINNPLTIIKGTEIVVNRFLQKELNEESYNKVSGKFDKI